MESLSIKNTSQACLKGIVSRYKGNTGYYCHNLFMKNGYLYKYNSKCQAFPMLLYYH